MDKRNPLFLRRRRILDGRGASDSNLLAVIGLVEARAIVL